MSGNRQLGSVVQTLVPDKLGQVHAISVPANDGIGSMHCQAKQWASGGHRTARHLCATHTAGNGDAGIYHTRYMHIAYKVYDCIMPFVYEDVFAPHLKRLLQGVSCCLHTTFDLHTATRAPPWACSFASHAYHQRCCFPFHAMPPVTACYNRLLLYPIGLSHS